MFRKFDLKRFEIGSLAIPLKPESYNMLFQERIRQDVAGILLVNYGLVLEFHHYFPNPGCSQIDAFDEILTLGVQDGLSFRDVDNYFLFRCRKPR